MVKFFPFLFLFFSIAASTEQAFETFDGQVYNGRYYPRIDIIEWGEPLSHMEFQVYWKGHPIEMTFQLVTKERKKVMLVHYYIRERDEHLCRKVLAPAHFSEGFMVYQDTSDKDMDNTIVTMDKLPAKAGLTLISSPQKYASCDMPRPNHAERAPAGQPNDQKRRRGDKGAIKKSGAATPFSDW